MEIFRSLALVPKSGFSWVDGFSCDVDVVWGRDEPEDAGLTCSTHRYLTLNNQQELDTGDTFDLLTEKKGLFRDFANLDGSEAGILEFANENGFLGACRNVLSKDDLYDFDLDDQEDLAELMSMSGSIHGEIFSTWSGQIAAMKSLVDLWSALRSGQPVKLRQVIERDNGLYRFRDDSIRPAEEDHRRFGQDLDAVSAGWTCLRQRVSESISRLGEHTLSWQNGELAIRFQVITLRQGLWLQFARAIEGNKSYERCRHCSRYFEIGPSAGRKGKSYCSAACRTAAYRARKERRA